jgi:hypothetical protein
MSGAIPLFLPLGLYGMYYRELFRSTFLPKGSRNAVLTAVLMVYRGMSSCRLVYSQGEAHCSEDSHNVPPKRRYSYTDIHGVTSHSTQR